MDTHLDFHVAVALDNNLGRRLGELAVPTTTKGYKRLLCWAEDFGAVRCAGVEGTSSYGAGLARYLRAAGVAVAEAAPELLALPAVGTDHAATLLVVAGDNPERLRSEASFASLCGVSPVEASSGKVVRYRLNRGGNRDANRALHMICMVRMGSDRRTREYVARRTAEGKSKREILRCLKRYVARKVYRVLVVAVEASPSTTAYPGASSGRLSIVS